ncbi:uncharacterized protein LOC143276484 [Babylonia areolata]|uniref:uncharacterized protein LOC143276484 n=1 Tax=Babylonia areolata TaxID=304850 RepID=UPI003FD5AEC6
MTVVVSGNVSVKVQGVLKQKQLPGNWAVLYDGGGGKTERLPRIELFEEKTSGTPLLTIDLEHLKFSDKSHMHRDTVLVLSIKKEKHHFQFENVENKEDWIQGLCFVSEDLWKQQASSRESSEIENEGPSADMSENLLYDSCDNVQKFKVSIIPTKGSEANNLKGFYMLNPSRDSLRLLEIDSIKSVHEWHYTLIKSYRGTNKNFRMEVGRRCTTGAGVFEFFTPVGDKLALIISTYMRELERGKQGHGQQEAAAASAAPLRDGYVESQTFRQMNSDVRVQQASAATDPQRTSESMREPETGVTTTSRPPPRGSSSSLDSKREAPKPAPRTSINRSKRDDGFANGVSQAAHASGDTKIYETPSGLTAPLDSQLKQELHSKLNASLPASHDPLAQSEDDPVSDTTEGSTDKHGSVENIKDKRKSDKERKKLEKEQKVAEAKLKKKQEKEQREREKELKEQREREAKEEKERQKRLKKEKLKSKKSLDMPAPVPRHMSDGNIYEEPEELQLPNRPAPTVTGESDYCEAEDFAPVPSTSPKSANAQAAEGSFYAMPQKSKDSWKTRARPESQHVHQENYLAIKQAAQSQSESQPPPIPLYPDSVPSFLSADGGESDYSHIGQFIASSPAVPENVYGMASAKDTLQANPPSKSAVGVDNDYAEADTFRAAKAVNVPVDGDYADVHIS